MVTVVVGGVENDDPERWVAAPDEPFDPLGLLNCPGLMVMDRLKPSTVMVLPDAAVTDPTAVVTVRGAAEELVAPDAAPANRPAPANPR